VSEDLVAYLRARLDEEAYLAPRHHYAPCAWLDWLDDRARSCDCGYPARVLADIEAKRRIVDRFVALLGYAARPYDKPEHAAKRRWVPFDRKHHARPSNALKIEHRQGCGGSWLCMCPGRRRMTLGQAIRHREKVTRIHSAYRLRSKRRRGER
jgi:hypothetical protein